MNCCLLSRFHRSGKARENMGQLWEKAENGFMTSYKVFASAILDIDVENSRKLFYDVIQYEVIKSAVLDFATSSFC